MKNIIVACVFTFTGLGLSAQEGMKVGVQGGLPLDDFNDEVGVVVGFDLGYMWALGEVVDLGVAAGFINGFPEKFQTGTVMADLPNVQFAPLAGSIRIWPSNSFSFGVDAGNAFGINKGNDGGLYYRPILGYLMGANTEVNLSYTTVKLEDRSWTTINFGILYTIKLHSDF